MYSTKTHYSLLNLILSVKKCCKKSTWYATIDFQYIPDFVIEYRVATRDVACFQTKAMFTNTTRKKQDTRFFNKIKDCLIGPLELALDGEKL